MPEGSYLISTGFDASSLELNVIRKFRFFAAGRVHEVRVAHSQCIWQVICDGKLVERKAHKRNDSTGNVVFQVLLEDGVALHAVLHMDFDWQSLGMVWKYSLTVNSMVVPAVWTKQQGEIRIGEKLPVAYGQIRLNLDSHKLPKNLNLSRLRNHHFSLNRKIRFLKEFPLIRPLVHTKLTFEG